MGLNTTSNESEIHRQVQEAPEKGGLINNFGKEAGMKAKLILVATVSLLFVPVLGFPQSIRYYNADGLEISAAAYQEESRKYVKKYHAAIKRQAGIKTDPVLQVIEMSGMDQAIAAFPALFDAQFEQRKRAGNVTEIDLRIAKIIQTSFDQEAAGRNLYEFLKKNIDQKTLWDTIAWLETPVAIRITKEENKANSVEAQAETLRYIAGMQNNPPPPVRVAVINKLVKEAKLVESTIEGFINAMAGMMGAVNYALPDVQKVSKEQIKSKISDLKPMLEQSMGQQITLSTFYTYRNISNADLEKYIAFLSSDSGQRFQDIGIEAISYTLNQFFAGLAQELKASFKS